MSEFQKNESLASLVKRLGTPFSPTLLQSCCKVFHIPQVDGAIGYHQIGNCAIVIGDPICLPPDSKKLAQAFHVHCQKSNLKTLYLLTSQDFAHWAIHNGCRTLIQVGSELSINPIDFQIKHKLRWQVNRAIQHGVRVEEYKTFDPSLENQMKSTIETWLKQRRGPQIHLGIVNFFNKDVEKRIFYARHKDKVMGVLMLIRLDRFRGWVASSYLAIRKAPVGTTEHLICSAIDSLAREKCPFLSLGGISGNKLGEVIGISFVSKILANLIFKVVRFCFKLDAKAIYLHKFHPCFSSTFLLCRDKLTISELLKLKQVLNVKL